MLVATSAGLSFADSVPNERLHMCSDVNAESLATKMSCSNVARNGPPPKSTASRKARAITTSCAGSIAMARPICVPSDANHRAPLTGSHAEPSSRSLAAAASVTTARALSPDAAACALSPDATARALSPGRMVSSSREVGQARGRNTTRTETGHPKPNTRCSLRVDAARRHHDPRGSPSRGVHLEAEFEGHAHAIGLRHAEA